MKNQEYAIYGYYYPEYEPTVELITESYNGQSMTIAVPVK